MTKVLALDLATRAGFAFGAPGKYPISGSMRFAAPGATHEAIFASAMRWITALIKKFKPDVVVWEAPLATSFKKGGTNINTTTILYGLPAIIGCVAYLLGIYDIRRAETRKVRMHFIGANPKRVIAKKKTMEQCGVLGWPVEDDNEADALAVWCYVTALIDPAKAVFPTSLFPATELKSKRKTKRL